MNPTQYKEILAQAAAEKWSYPKVFDALKAAGVQSYDVRVAQHEIIYHSADGNFREGPPSDFKPSPAADQFNQEGVIAAIRRTQRKETTYPQFLQEIAAAGTHTYRVDMAERSVSYHGAHGEKYVEKVPQSS